MKDPKEARGWRLAVLRTGNVDEDMRRQFPACRPENLYSTAGPWPELRGCLAILFTARSGSTFLSRELEKRYAIGQIRESLSPPALLARSERQDLRSPAAALRMTMRSFQEGGWFAFKTGPVGLVVAERCSFFERYLERTCFIRLLRRDVIAQAVSLVKARATGIFHVREQGAQAEVPANYSYDEIAHSLRTVVRGVADISLYAERTGRPCRKVFYEEFAEGSFAAVDEICNAFGIPIRKRAPRFEYQQIERTGDHVNEEWCARFRKQMNRRVCRLIDKYHRLIED